MLESEVEKKLVQGVKKLGGLCLKWVSPGYSGVPDRIVFLPCGCVYFVELKREGETLRPRQRYVHKKLMAINTKVFTLTGVDEVQEFLDEVKMKQDILSIFYDKAFCKRSYKAKQDDLSAD